MRPGSPRNSKLRLSPSAVSSLSVVDVRSARALSFEWIANWDRSDATGTSNRMSSIPWFHTRSTLLVRRGPLTCCSAWSKEAKDPSNGSEARTSITCGDGSRRPSSYTARLSPTHSDARSLSTRST